MSGSDDRPVCGQKPRMQGLYVVVGLGLLVTAVVFSQLQSLSLRNRQEKFLNLTEQRITVCANAIADMFHVVNSLVVLRGGQDRITRTQYHDFAAMYMERHKGIQSLQWVRCVPDGERHDYEQQTRREGMEDFRITEGFRLGTRMTATQRPVYFPIHFVEPYAGNTRSLGLDLGSDPVWNEALLRARDSGDLVVTLDVSTSDGDPNAGTFCLIQPVYRQDAFLITEADRRAHLTGFIVGIFATGPLIEEALRATHPGGIDVELLDIGQAEGPRRLYRHESRLRPADARYVDSASDRNRWTVERSLDLGRRRWMLRCDATSQFFRQHRSWAPMTGLIVGLIITGFAGLHYRGQLLRMETVGRLVAQKTRDLDWSSAALKQRNGFLRHILASLTHPLYVIDAGDFTVTLSNQGHSSANGAPGAKCYEIICGRSEPCDGRAWPCTVEGVRTSGKACVIERVQQDPEGRERTIEVRGYPVLDDDGRVSHVIEYHLDITERKRAEEMQREHTNELTAIYDNAPLMMLLVDGDRRIRKANRFALTFAGCSEQEMMGRCGGDALRCLHTLSNPAGCGLGRSCADCTLRETVLDTLETGENHNQVEARLPFAIDGKVQELTFLLSTARVHIQNEPMALVSILDITDRKQADRRIAEQLAFTRILLDTIPNPVYYKDRQGRYLGANRAFAEFVGLPESEIAGKTVFDLAPEDLADKYHQRDQELLAQPGTQHYEWQARNAAGQMRDVMFDKATLTVDGRVGGLIGVISDITERKQAEDLLRIQKDLLAHVLANIPAFVFWKDRNCRFLGCNENFARSAGVGRPENIVGKTDHDLIWRNDAEVYQQDDRRIMDSGEPLLAFEETQTTEDGGQTTRLTSKVPLRDATGAVVGVLGVYTDITEHKRAEQRQAALLKEVESANAELTDFAHVVSHDLKAPLRGIQTVAEWLAADFADRLGEDGKRQVELLVDRVGRAYRLIDGVLQYSRVSRNREDRAPVDLASVVADVIDGIAPPEHITVAVDGSLPTVLAEPTRMTQLFQNLLSNAVKYIDKERGRVEVTCSDEGAFWRFSIADNGPGIEQKYFDKIFQIFQMLGPRTSGDSTGIGLTIAKKIVALHGGTIWLESQLGEGTTFLFTLPKTECGGLLDAVVETSTACRR